MDSRRAAAAVFVALCLGLSGLALHRQIAAHPAPPEGILPSESEVTASLRDFGRPLDKKTWHVAAGPPRSEALTVIQTQLAAFRTGDADKAMFYQSRSARSNFHSAEEFVTMILYFYPEFGHARSVQFGPLWMNPTEQYADVTVTVRGENGRLARGYYQLIREAAGYRVASVQGGHAIP